MIAGIAAAVGVGIGGTADGTLAVLVAVAGGGDDLAGLDGLAADGADLIAGVAGLGAGGVLGVFHHGAVTGGGQRLGGQYLIAVIADDGDRAVLGTGGRGLGAGGVVVIAGDLHGDEVADGVQLLRRGEGILLILAHGGDDVPQPLLGCVACIFISFFAAGANIIPDQKPCQTGVAAGERSEQELQRLLVL